MKTAASYLEGIMSFNLASFVEAVNLAREDAIRECAERAQTKETYIGNSDVVDVVVDKDSILKLVSELK